MLGKPLPLVSAGRVDVDLTPAEAIQSEQTSLTAANCRRPSEAAPRWPAVPTILPRRRGVANRIDACGS
jgi:hypothetical protein